MDVEMIEIRPLLPLGPEAQAWSTEVQVPPGESGTPEE